MPTLNSYVKLIVTLFCLLIFRLNGYGQANPSAEKIVPKDGNSQNEKKIPTGKLLLRSTLFPGWGNYTLQKKKGWWFMGVGAYGSVAGSVIFWRLAVKNFDIHNEKENDTEYENKGNSNLILSNVFLASAITLLATEYITVYIHAKKAAREKPIEKNKNTVDYSRKLLYQKDNRNLPLKNQNLSLIENDKVIQKTTTDEKGGFSFKNINAETDKKVTLDPNSGLSPEVKVMVSKEDGTIEKKLEKDSDGLYRINIPRMESQKRVDTEEDNIYYDILYGFTKRHELEYKTQIKINYALNSWEILPEAQKELDDVINALYKYPDVSLEISSHTDARGNEADNLKLSDKRAQEVVSYIINNSINVVAEGINSNRVSGKGYGESQILNRCKSDVHCTEEEHSVNRRTEFKFIKK